MPKRSAEQRIERYIRKIRKLERKRDDINNDFSSSENEVVTHYEIVQEPEEVIEANIPPVELEPTILDSEEVNVPETRTVDTSTETPSKPIDAHISTQGVEIPEVTETLILDPELVSALGESTDDTPEFGEKIVDNLAKLWIPLLKKGWPKEVKEKTLKEYNIPENCRLLQAPKLNPEISAAIPDMVRNRDKRCMETQQQLGCAVTAINRAMDILLRGDDSKIHALKHLSNGCRILCDLHAINTQHRIRCIVPSLDRTFLHVIQDAERDETVFGNKLSEKIKAAKAIEKQGLQIKRSVSQKNTNLTTQSVSTNLRPIYSGNWPAPPRYPYPSNRGGRGGPKRTPMNTRRPYTLPQPNKNPSQHRPRAPTQ